MNAKFFYVYIIAGLIFVALIVYDLLWKKTAGYTIIYDAVIALFLFYRAYRTYMEKKDQELM